MPLPHAALQGLSVFERGWLSSNNVLIHGRGEGATLVDTSHCLHAAQTVALVGDSLRRAGGAEPLSLVLNTHLHSDHCGGNAALRREFGAPLHIPQASWTAVRDWDVDALGYRPTGQRCERFEAQGTFSAGERLHLGGRIWEVLAAPGHDPHSLMLFDTTHGVLISADALWENGFGLVFPELQGEPGFDDVAAVLDQIETLPVQCVVPGHGAPFTDVAGACKRARSRLHAMQLDPPRHARHAAKVLLKYHLMEERTQPLPALLQWAEATPLFVAVWRAQRHGASSAEWFETLVGELVASNALRLGNGIVSDA